MRRVRWCGLIAVAVWLGSATTQAAEEPGWSRVDSLYCTVWLHPDVAPRTVEKRIGTFFLHGWRIHSGFSVEERLAEKCDVILKAVERSLEMYPAGLRVTIKVYRSPREIAQVHAERYGFGADADAFYIAEEDTIYTTVGSVSTSVLAHEMAHSVMNHYFTVRPPRKIEELLAIHVDEHLGEEGP